MSQVGYVTVDAKKMKPSYPEFQQTLASLETQIIEKAKEKWPGVTYEGLKLNSTGFGRTSILPGMFAGFGAVLPAALTTWRQLFTVVGEQIVLQGPNLGQVMPNDIMIALAGFAIPSSSVNITELRWITSDRQFVRVNLEELQTSEDCAAILEEGWIIQEQERFVLNGFVEAVGYQRVIPLGFAVYKKRDKVIGATGSAVPVT